MRRANFLHEVLAVSRRYVRRTSEAEDVVQEVLIAAIGAGRDDFSNARDRRWIMGAIRRRAAFDARSAVRRRERETRWQAEQPDQTEDQPFADIEAVLVGLPKSLRIVAALALSGHTRAEIAYLLDLTDTTLRQRIRALKLALSRAGLAVPEQMAGLNLDLAYGSIRQALVPALRRHKGALATHDPDGHLIVFRKSSQKG